MWWTSDEVYTRTYCFTVKKLVCSQTRFFMLNIKPVNANEFTCCFNRSEIELHTSFFVLSANKSLATSLKICLSLLFIEHVYRDVHKYVKNPGLTSDYSQNLNKYVILNYVLKIGRCKWWYMNKIYSFNVSYNVIDYHKLI